MTDIIKQLRELARNMADGVAGMAPQDHFAWEAAAEIDRLQRLLDAKTAPAGWEVEGFIDRLTRRNDANSERLVLEAISHLRGFSRDYDALRESNARLVTEVERLRAALRQP